MVSGLQTLAVLVGICLVAFAGFYVMWDLATFGWDQMGVVKEHLPWR